MSAALVERVRLRPVEIPLAHAQIARALRTDVQLGENHEGATEVERSIHAGASDLVMLDSMKIGGVTGWRQASALAARAGIPVSSHSFPEISAHLLACRPERLGRRRFQRDRRERPRQHLRLHRL